jgi:hypothetical protein
MLNSEKGPPRTYICALVSTAHTSVSEEVEGHKIILFFLIVPNVSFQEVEWYKHNFVSLSGFFM